MSNFQALASSLFTADRTSASSTRSRVERAVQRFEGLLWDQVAQAMSSVHLGPSNLGYAGQMYQRMLWHKVASQDFAPTDQALTRATLNQLMPASASHTAHTTLAAVTSRSTVPSVNGASPIAKSQAPASETWVQEIWHAIEHGAKALGVPAKGLLAQAALETGWGTHVSAHNIFGVKAHGAGPNFTALTHEFTDGVLRQVKAAFQGYGSVAHAVTDFVHILQEFHPEAIGQSTVAGYARALQRSGYATDPRYAHKLEAVANSARMRAALARVKS